MNPVKENERPKLALEALLRAAPLLTSSNSSFSCALLDFLMCVFLPLAPARPGDAAVIIRRLDFLERVPPPSDAPAVSLDTGDLNAADSVSTNWSDFVLAKLVELTGFSMLSTDVMRTQIRFYSSYGHFVLIM